MPLHRGSSVGPYEVLARLGAGGMGEVWRARDPRLGREVAIKVLTDATTSDRDRLRRFVAEAKAASALNHPNILTVHEIGETDSGPYIVTELVDGQTVRELLTAGPLATSRALDIAIQAAEGVAKAHEAGIVHRDLKPENLMVTRDGLVKVLDFGLAKLVLPDSGDAAAVRPESATATGMIVGTAGYLSPEQLRAAPADGRSDVFSLGIVLYEMLAGDNPFRRDSAADTFFAILRDVPAPLADCAPDVPPDLSRAVARALAKKPEDRFPGARSLALELKRIRSRIESGSAATALLPGESAKQAPRRRRWMLATGGLAAAALMTAAILFFGRRSPMLPHVRLPPDVQYAVAVLPIDDESGDPELSRAKIGKILGDAFVQILSDVPKVYVVSPIRLEEVSRTLNKGSVADATKDPDLAVKLSRFSGANVMLSGRLSRLGKTYILDAELTRLPDTLMGKFQASTDTVEKLLPELTGGVAEKIQEKIGTSSTRDASQVATGSIAAYEHFVRGYDLQNEGDFQASTPELEKAVEIDPRMGLGWSFLACGYSFGGEDTKALEAQWKAEHLLGTVNRKERRWIELNGTWVKSRNSSVYRQQAEKYIRDYPDDREGYFYAGLAAEWLEGDCARAIPYFEKAYRLTPTYYPIVKGIVDCNLKLDRRSDAIAVLKRYLALPGVAGRAHDLAQGRLAELKKSA